MPTRAVNWKLAAVLVIATVLLVVGAYHLWQWQSQRAAAYELAAGMQSYEQYEWDSAAFHFGRYLDLVDNDIPVMLRYAEAFLNLRPLKRSYIERAIATYREILRTDRTNEEALTRLVRTYFELNMPSEVEFILYKYADVGESLEFKKMLAVALIKQRKTPEATDKLEAILQENPESIEAYELLAKLAERYQGTLARAEAALWLDKAIDNNPESAAAYIARGQFHLRSGGEKQALADFSVAEKCDLSEPLVRLQLGQGYIKASRFDKAIEHLRLVQKALPHSLALWQSLAELALTAESKELMLEVAEQGIRELTYQPWDFKSIAAQLYIEGGRSDLAAELVSQLRLRDIEPARVEYLRGLLAYEQSGGYEAIKYFKRSLELGGDRIKNRQKIAATLAELGDEQSATKQFRILVTEGPGLIKARLNLARLLVRSARLDEAAEQAQLAKLAAPEDMDAEILHMHILIQRFARRQLKPKHQGWQNLQKKLDELEKRWPDNVGVQELKVRLAMQQSEWQRAKQLLEQMAGRYPRRMEIDLANAQLLIVLGRTDEAIELLHQTMQAYPDSVEPVRLLAALAAQKGDLQRCEDLLRDALERVQSMQYRRELVLLMSGMYARAGEADKRAEFIRSYLESSGDDICLIRELFEINLASGETEEAQKLIGQVKTIEGDDGWQWRYEQARLWFASEQFDNRYQPIVSILKENLEANADDQYSRILLAQVYERAGQLKLAVLACKDVLGRSVGDVKVSGPAVAILYHVGEYDYADRIIEQMASQRAWSPELKAIEFRSFLHRGEFDLAVELLGDILAVDDSSGSPSMARGSLRVNERLKDEGVCEALLLSNEIVERFQNAEAHVIRAMTYVELDRSDKAMEDFEHAVRLEPNNVEIWLAKARFDCSVGQAGKAVADAKKALDVAHGDPDVSKLVLPILISATDDKVRTEARTILDGLLLRYPDDLQLQLYQSRYLISAGTSESISKAETILHKISQQHDAPVEVWSLLTEISLIRGNHNKAMEIVLAGLAREGEDKSLLRLKAKMEVKTSAKLAIPTLQLLCELYPRDAFAAISLADAYLETDQPSRAVELLQKYSETLKARQGRRQIDIKMAVALYREGKTGLAAELFTELSNGTDADAEVIMLRVQLLIDEQNWDRVRRIALNRLRENLKDDEVVVAIAGELARTQDKQAQQTAQKLLEHILEADPNCVAAMRVLAEQSYVSSRFSKAAQLYKRIMAVAPDDIKAVNNLCWIMCEKDKQYFLALELAEKGLTRNPGCAELVDTRGMVYYRLGKYEKAVEDFSRALTLSKVGSRTALFSHVHLGNALARLGRTQAAVENLNQALQLHDYVGGLKRNDIVEIKNLIQDISGGV